MKVLSVVISCIIDVYLFHLFFQNYFSKRKFFADSVLKEKSCQIGIVILLTICNLLGNGDVNILITPALFFLYTVLEFQGKVCYRLLCFATVFCILCGCEFLFMLLVRPNASDYKNSTLVMILMLAIKLLSYILILIMNQVIGKRKKIQDFKIFIMYMIIPAASLFVMIIVFYSGAVHHMAGYVSAFLGCSFAVLFLGNVMSFYAFERYSERLYETMEQNIVIIKQKKDLEYYMQISEIDKKQKELIHNITNQIKMIYVFAKDGNTKAILELTDSIGEEMEKDSRMVYCDNPVLNSLLNEKRREAGKQGIHTDFYVEPGVLLQHVAPMDLISMLGNLLDNAIRAAAETQGEKYIKSYVYMKEVGGFCVIKITNPFENIKHTQDGDFATTKKDDGMHGIGLHSVRRIAEKYGGCLMCTTEDKTFETVLLISTDEEI